MTPHFTSCPPPPPHALGPQLADSFWLFSWLAFPDLLIPMQGQEQGKMSEVPLGAKWKDAQE